MIRSSVEGSRASTSNLNLSLLSQDNSPLNILSPPQSNNNNPQINKIKKSKDNKDIVGDPEQIQKIPNNNSEVVFRNGNRRELLWLCGKLDTIQETNIEISCVKKDGVSILNFNNSGNNINHNLISILYERNFIPSQNQL